MMISTKSKWSIDVIVLIAQFAFDRTIMHALFGEKYVLHDYSHRTCFTCGLSSIYWNFVRIFRRLPNGKQYSRNCCSPRCLQIVYESDLAYAKDVKEFFEFNVLECIHETLY